MTALLWIASLLLVGFVAYQAGKFVVTVRMARRAQKLMQILLQPPEPVNGPSFGFEPKGPPPVGWDQDENEGRGGYI